MVRTQIQLPDELYRDIKRLADEKEWSLAEALRRGAELLLKSYPSSVPRKNEWRLPGPFSLGELEAPPEHLRELANQPED